MITTSEKFKAAIIKSGRHFKTKLVVEDETYTEFISLKIKGGTNSGDEITLGDTVSSFLEAQLAEVPKTSILKGKKAILHIGLQVEDELVEWIKVGTYNLEKSTRSDNILKLTAYDNFALCNKGFFSDLKGNQKIVAVLNEQCKKIGISFIGGADDVSYNVDNLQGLTIREAIGILAAYCGKNAIMNADGDLKFVWYTNTGLEIDASQFADPFDTDEEDTYINKLDCAIDDDNSVSVGMGVGIYFSCPGMTQDRINVLYNRIKGFTYRSAKLNWKMAHPGVEAGDVITVVDKYGSKYAVPMMSYEFSCDGGFYGTVESKGKSEEQKENEYKGPLQTKVERTYSELLSAKKIITDAIDAYNGKFETIDTNFLTINKKLTANEVELNTIKGDHAEFKTTVTNSLDAINAKIVNLNVDVVNAAIGKIGTLESDVANIGTIINRVTTSDSIHSLLINAETAVIDSGYFKTIVSQAVTVNDLLAGDISTTKFKVKSDSGNFVIADNTLQIKDATRVRVQIGKDSTNDYSLSLWDSAGKLIWDARGLKADGIKDAIIRNDMVSPNANIDGGKLNISSVVTSINNGTTKIESSSVLYDGKTLNVAFGLIETSVTTVTKTVTDNKNKWDTASTNASTALTNASTALNKSTEALTNSSEAATNASNALTKATSVENRANNGDFDGKGVKGSNVTYQASTSGTSAPTGTWSATVPSVSAGQYLWTRTIFTYTDNTTTTTYIVTRMGTNGTQGGKGDKGDTGNGITSITPHYLASASATGVTTSTTGWTTTPQSTSSSKRYLWSYQTINYTSGTPTTTAPAIVGVYGDTGAQGATGATGKGINSVTPQYYLSTSSTAQTGGSWVTAQPAYVSGRYYWTRDAIVWSDNTTTYTTPTLASGLNSANANAQSALTQVTTVTETVNTHTTKLTAQEGQIGTLISDTTQAKSDITAIRGEVTTAKGNISSLQTNYSNLNQTVSGLSSTVGSHSSQLTTIKGTAESALSLINGLEIGGRNLIRGSAKGGADYYAGNGTLVAEGYNGNSAVRTTGAWAGYCIKSLDIVNRLNLKVGDIVTLSIYVSTDSETTITTPLIYLYRHQGNGGVLLGSVNVKKGEWKRIKLTYPITDLSQLTNNTRFESSVSTNYGILWSCPKLEKGSKATDYTLAPEDVASDIATVDGRITAEIKTVTDKYTSLEQNVDGFKATVSSTYSTKTELTNAKNEAINSANTNTTNLLKSYATTSAMNSAITQKANEITSAVSKTYATQTALGTTNSNVSSLTTRMSTAEQKITDSAIVSTVTKSTSWTTLNSTATDAQTKANSLVDLTTVKDTRSVNNNPQWYFTNYPRKTVKEFKTCTTVGISGEGTYGTLETSVSYPDTSGGYPTQLFYPNNSQNIYRRVGTSATAWGAWTKVAGSHNIVSTINQTAETVKIDASKIELTGKVTISMLDSSTQTKVNNGNSAMTSINTNKANWDKGLTAYNWTNSNGANMTNLRAMVMKWTNNAVSTSTYIQGGWIATNTITSAHIVSKSITADKLNVTTLSSITANIGAITSGSLNIGNGKFVVDSSGNLTSQNASINGYATISSLASPGAVTINGGNVQIGDGTNMCKNNVYNNIYGNTLDYNDGADNGSPFFALHTAYESVILCSYKNCDFVVGDRFLLQARAWNYSAGEVVIYARYYYTDGTYENAGVTPFTAPSSVTEISAELIITVGLQVNKVISHIDFAVERNGSTTGWFLIKNMRLRKKYNGSLIVNGSITADHIASKTLYGVTVTGGSITSNSTINVTTNLTVGNNIYLGNQSSTSIAKFIYMNSTNYLQFSTGNTGVQMRSGNYVGMTGGSGYVSATSNYVQCGSQIVQFIASNAVYSNKSITVTSDARKKNSITEVDVSWIDELKIKSFKYNESNANQIGLIAQDYLEKSYAKYFMSIDPDGYYGITYGNITNALIKYSQETKKIVSSHEYKITSNESRIQELERRFAEEHQKRLNLEARLQAYVTGEMEIKVSQRA